MQQTDPERNTGRKWSETDLQALRELIVQQLPIREIAERLGRTEYAVRWKASQARISLKPAAPPLGPRRPR